MNPIEVISNIAYKYNLDSVGIFGSRARGDYREDSDYDIFIIGNLSLEKELSLEDELERELNNGVDIIKLSKDTDKILLKNIVNEANLIYSKNNSFEKLYEFVEIFFAENSDFIHMRESDLLD
ncbi:nucleotidyltransferase family protein [Clostridium sp.]|uniref:nucleotidyltransferase family protein n=1 Tax=Clostridium sp. TaxID=1506 RepID=UPI00260BF7FB|nr:nucleotidyltransferase domain-containing protein [Clostridium sp.]